MAAIPSTCKDMAKEIHTAFRELLQETEKTEGALDQQRRAVQQQGGQELKQLQGDIGLQRQAAVNRRDAEIGMAQQQIDEAKRQTDANYQGFARQLSAGTATEHGRHQSAA